MKRLIMKAPFKVLFSNDTTNIHCTSCTKLT